MVFVESKDVFVILVATLAKEADLVNPSSMEGVVPFVESVLPFKSLTCDCKSLTVDCNEDVSFFASSAFFLYLMMK